ncbi:MAG: hypothetical protein L0H41_01015 [Microlunatus sp.]|nr:hypothetical protein [Microlunatus sp.]MDN5772041.1 hypothetical protein [Microlunatus sp.]
MGELRLYAIGIEEMRGIIGAGNQTPELRAAADRAFAPAVSPKPRGLIAKLGPLFKRPPDAPVLSPTDPEPLDVDALLAGAYISPERTGASWRVLEALTQYRCWGSTRMPLTLQSLDELDFALARGGVAAAVGLGHLLASNTDVRLIPVPGLTVGWHRHDKALAMAGAYRAAMPQIKSEEQRELVSALATWLDGFIPWSQVAADLGRPVPDLVGFWAS